MPGERPRLEGPPRSGLDHSSLLRLSWMLDEQHDRGRPRPASWPTRRPARSLPAPREDAATTRRSVSTARTRWPRFATADGPCRPFRGRDQAQLQCRSTYLHGYRRLCRPVTVAGRRPASMAGAGTNRRAETMASSSRAGLGGGPTVASEVRARQTPARTTRGGIDEHATEDRRDSGRELDQVAGGGLLGSRARGGLPAVDEAQGRG